MAYPKEVPPAMPLDVNVTLVMRFADEMAQRIARRTVRALAALDEGLQSGEDSGLKSIWDEVCVQVQGERFTLWAFYESVVDQCLGAEIEVLRPHERSALWLQSVAGGDWWSSYGEHGSAPPYESDSILEVLRERVYELASGWSNARIRAYLERDSIRD